MELDTGAAVSLVSEKTYIPPAVSRYSNAGVDSITQDLLRRATQGSGPEGSGGACRGTDGWTAVGGCRWRGPKPVWS